MSNLTVHLFGRFQVQQGDQALDGLNARRVQEFFAYLLLNRTRSFAREALANLLWPNSSAEQATKYLRHALWQLKSALNCDVLLVDAEWVGLCPQADLWLDVQEFEHAYARVYRVPGHELNEQQAQTLQQALELYRGDLLESCYQDWCLFERERLQQMYLDLLTKQTAYCEASGDYAAGLEYGTCALRYDMAHEGVHRLLMRLHYLAGNRTAALRQYQRCVTFLRQELDVSPSECTVALLEQIRADQPLYAQVPISDNGGQSIANTPPTLGQALQCLNQLQASVTHATRQLQEVVDAVERLLNDQD